MSDPLPSLAPIAWVFKRDGRQVPFEADKISRSLFAASEAQGHPDPFLARELTDSVLHFIRHEFGEQTRTTPAIADLVAKVVRELGHPGLAREYESLREQRSKSQPRTATQEPRKQYQWIVRTVTDLLSRDSALDSEAATQQISTLLNLSRIYSSDILAAQNDGLIRLGGVRSATRMEAAVTPHQSDPLELLKELAAYRQAAGDVLVFDSPDLRLWSEGSHQSAAWGAWIQTLRLGLGDQGCRAILNLNRRAGTGGKKRVSYPSLFGDEIDEMFDQGFGSFQARFVEEAVAQSTDALQIHWYLTDQDFGREYEQLLHALARLALDGRPLTFVFERPRHISRLAFGLAAGQHAILLTVGLGLQNLVRLMGTPVTPERFLTKLASLVRLSLSAATQKRTWLRQRRGENAILDQAFYLENARVVLTPLDLDSVVTELTGERCCGRSGAGLSLGRDILDCLRHAATEDGRALLLNSAVDSPIRDDFGAETRLAKEADNTRAGITTWDDQAPMPRQISTSASLQEAARGGTALIRWPGGARPTVEECIEALRFAWEKTGVLAVRFAGEATSP
jgi:hypothetical protein